MSNTGSKLIDRSMHTTNEWLKELTEKLGRDDRDNAIRALRATLHAVRDRLTAEEAADFAAQLPLVIRGIYYEGWRPSEEPVRDTTLESFLDSISEGLPDGDDMPAPGEAYRAVFDALGELVDDGILEHVKGQLSKPVTDALH